MIKHITNSVQKSTTSSAGTNGTPASKLPAKKKLSPTDGQSGAKPIVQSATVKKETPPPVSTDSDDLAGWVLTDEELRLATLAEIAENLPDDCDADDCDAGDCDAGDCDAGDCDADDGVADDGVADDGVADDYDADDGVADDYDADDGVYDDWGDDDSTLKEQQRPLHPEEDLAPKSPSDFERYELAVQAMLNTCKPLGSYEGIAKAQARLQSVCDIAVLYDNTSYGALIAVYDYADRYPFPSPWWEDVCDIDEYRHRSETRVQRGAALLPIGVEIVIGTTADHFGKRTIVAKLGDASHSDFFDLREDSRIVKFCHIACEKFDLKWAEAEIYQLVLKKAEREATKQPVDKYDIGELLQKFPHRRPPVIDGLAREGETLNFISYSKAGKSWLGCQLALSIVFGLLWLGRFSTSRGRVLIVDNELSKDEISHRMGVVAKAMGIEVHELDGQIEIWSLRENPRSLDELQADFDAIPPGTFRLIILDAEYKFLPPGINENDNAAIAQFHGRVTSIASRLNALVALVHHASKGPQDGKRLTDIGSGAGAQSRAVDCHIVLLEHEIADTVVLNAALRSFPPVKPLVLQLKFPILVPIEGADPSQLRIEPTKGERRQKANDRKGKEAILEALRKSGPATRRQLRDLVEFGDTRLQRLLNLLVHDDGVIVTETMVKGNDTNLYGLPSGQK